MFFNSKGNANIKVEGVAPIRDGKILREKAYFHIIKTIGKDRYALRKNGEWFKIDGGGGLLMDCAFQYTDDSADVWDISYE